MKEGKSPTQFLLKKRSPPLRTEYSSDCGDREAQKDRAAAEALARCSDVRARQQLSYDQSVALSALPLSLQKREKNEVIIFASSRMDYGQKNALRFATGMAVHLIEVTKDILERAIDIAYLRDRDRVSTALAALTQSDSRMLSTTMPDAQVHEGEIGIFLARLIEHAYALQASDLHLEPHERGCTIRIRIQGELLEGGAPLGSLELHARLVRRIKVISKLDIAQSFLPHDGAFVQKIRHTTIHVRTSIVPTVYGEKVVLRLLTNEGLTTLSQLGWGATISNGLERIVQKREGLILISGATGSGKTTTLYALAHELAAQGLAVASIEDPVERILPALAQTSVNHKIGLTYPIALRALVRQDPDVLLIGEMRDRESTEIAFHAAMTGHLVLTTVHGGSIEESLLRITELGVTPAVVERTLVLALCQRLLPTLCPHCKVIDVQTSSTHNATIYQEVGCTHCGHSGYLGMAPIGEMKRIERCNSDEHRSIHRCSMKDSILELGKEGKVPLRPLE